MPIESCPECGNEPEKRPHDEDCVLGEHEAMLDGRLDPEWHDEDACEICLLKQEVAKPDGCRCGRCCEHLLIEATALDARREPRIAERGSIIDEGGLVPREQAGWLLNRRGGRGCVFFSRDKQGRSVCEIYPTRPLACRLFDCDDPQDTAPFRDDSDTSRNRRHP